MELTLSEREKLNHHPIDHLIGCTLRLLSPLRKSFDPHTAEDAQSAWEAWKALRSIIVKSTR